MATTSTPIIVAQQNEIDRLKAEVERLRTLINSPHNASWFKGTRIEAAHQIERWGNEHDSGKEPQDWFWSR